MWQAAEASGHSGVRGDTIMGGKQVDRALEKAFLWPIHSLPTPRERKGHGGSVWGGGGIGEKQNQGDVS